MEHIVFVLVAVLVGWTFAMAGLELAHVVIHQKIRGSLLIFYFLIIGVIFWTLVTIASPAQTNEWGLWEVVRYRPPEMLHLMSVWGGAVVAVLQFFLFGPKKEHA